LVLFFLPPLFLMLEIFFNIPKGFSDTRIVEIKRGETISSVAKRFKNNEIIESELLFKILIRLRSLERGVIAGSYLLERSSLWGVVSRITDIPSSKNLVKITIPEGYNNREMAVLLDKNFENFNADNFLILTKEIEGYLFPDTYLFPKEIKEEEIIGELKSNFNKRMNSIKDAIENSDRKFEDIIIMASLLEEEARTTETRKIISGILWKRLDIGMALQVDAVFSYIAGENKPKVSFADLEVDSPYNTYKYAGLPPGPITNPGLDSILATLNPTPSDYWFYLSDPQGNMYYAQDFEGHKENRANHLR